MAAIRNFVSSSWVQTLTSRMGLLSLRNNPLPRSAPLLSIPASPYATKTVADGMKRYKPVTPGLRHRVIVSRKDLWKGKPFRPLTVALRKTGGRNNTGRITCRHRGGGHRRRLRIIDFKRNDLDGVEGFVERVEYDPNRSGRIALVKYTNTPARKLTKAEVLDHRLAAKRGESHAFMRYVLCPDGVKPGQILKTGANAPIENGNTLPLKNIPIGSFVHNIELHPGNGGKLVRSAGTAAQVVSIENGRALLKLPSGCQKLFLDSCRATLGFVSNKDHINRSFGKAGAVRWIGRRPTVRGVAMNPIDHKHGGGNGKHAKRKLPYSVYGRRAKYSKTRTHKAPSDVVTARQARHKKKALRG